MTQTIHWTGSSLPPTYSQLTIESAAAKATVALRALGIALPGAEDVPLFEEVKQYLTRLVADEAIKTFYELAKQAPADAEISAFKSDDALFDIEVAGVAARNEFSVSIWLRL